MTCGITVLAGPAQLRKGCLRVARGALAVSPAVVHGMLAGIGITIAVARLPIVLGGSPDSSVLADPAHRTAPVRRMPVPAPGAPTEPPVLLPGRSRLRLAGGGA